MLIRKLEKKIKKLSKEPAVGNINTNSSTRHAPKEAGDLYIGGVQNVSSPDEMRKLLRSQGTHNTTHVTVLTQSTDWYAYKVSLNQQEYTYAKTNRWPTGLRVRPFRPSRGPQGPASRAPKNQNQGRGKKFRPSHNQGRLRSNNSYSSSNVYQYGTSNDWPLPQESRRPRARQQQQKPSRHQNWNAGNTWNAGTSTTTGTAGRQSYNDFYTIHEHNC